MVMCNRYNANGKLTAPDMKPTILPPKDPTPNPTKIPPESSGNSSKNPTKLPKQCSIANLLTNIQEEATNANYLRGLAERPSKKKRKQVEQHVTLKRHKCIVYTIYAGYLLTEDAG